MTLQMLLQFFPVDGIETLAIAARSLVQAKFYLLCGDPLQIQLTHNGTPCRARMSTREAGAAGHINR